MSSFGTGYVAALSQNRVITVSVKVARLAIGTASAPGAPVALSIRRSPNFIALAFHARSASSGVSWV